MDKENIIVAACLLGENCKYHGGNNYNKAVCDLSDKYSIISVCPEMAGGLSTPREPAEIDSASDSLRVITKAGEDVTTEFLRGAEDTLKKAKEYNVSFCVLKEGSPTCGSKYIYDGTFSHVRLNKMGVTARALSENGFKVYSEEEIAEII